MTYKYNALEEKSSSLEFSILLLVAFQSRHMSCFSYKHINQLQTLKHSLPDRTGILNLFYFHSLPVESILLEITDTCIHTHSYRTQQRSP